MPKPIKQHLIDPEICIRCYTCEATCPIQAISHNDDNVVVDADKCNFCMACISPCPTGSIDEWRVVREAYTLEQQFGWLELPAQEALAGAADVNTSIEALDDSVAALLAEAHQGAGGKQKAPLSASKSSVNLYHPGKPAAAIVQGNYSLTPAHQEFDVRHIILDLGNTPLPILEGQSVGIIAPGSDAHGRPHTPRLYSVSSPRDGERPNHNNISLTVKRERQGVCSNHLCDLQPGAAVKLVGPFGSTFLLPDDPQARLLMICTGTGAAPFRGFTMRRRRTHPDLTQTMTLFFGARTPDGLPYFGPLEKIPDRILSKHFSFSRVPGERKNHVQDGLRQARDTVAALLQDTRTHIYICGLKAMESGVEAAFDEIAGAHGIAWQTLRTEMRESGRYHVETY